jgi:DNA-directed RNA polymerase subunit RPC12/RpoP
MKRSCIRCGEELGDYEGNIALKVKLKSGRCKTVYICFGCWEKASGKSMADFFLEHDIYDPNEKYRDQNDNC